MIRPCVPNYLHGLHDVKHYDKDRSINQKLIMFSKYQPEIDNVFDTSLCTLAAVGSISFSMMAPFRCSKKASATHAQSGLQKPKRLTYDTPIMYRLYIT